MGIEYQYSVCWTFGGTKKQDNPDQMNYPKLLSMIQGQLLLHRGIVKVHLKLTFPGFVTTEETMAKTGKYVDCIIPFSYLCGPLYELSTSLYC